MGYKNLFDIVEHLDADRRNTLIATCRDMGLSDAAIEDVEKAARLLRNFEIYSKPSIKTPAALRDSLKKIETLSHDLRFAISEAGSLDKVEMHEYMEECGIPGGLPWPALVPVHGIVDYLAMVLELLEDAASTVQRQSSHAVTKGGRRRLLHHYFQYLEWVWESVKDEGFVVGRNGKFERLCDAVFVAAGVPSSAEGAVRFFVENGDAIKAERTNIREHVFKPSEGMQRFISTEKDAADVECGTVSDDEAE